MQSNLSFGARLYFRIREFKLIRRYMRRLRRGDDLRLTNEDSRSAYEEYENQEQIQYENGSVRTLHNGRIERLSFRQIREIYLREIYKQIDELLAKTDGAAVSVLEVGCGNCINAKCLLEKYGRRISYTGFDLSPRRIAVSRQHWGEAIESAQLMEMSATEIGFADSSFDLVFSMHVLEQISYDTGTAIDEMIRVARDKVVMIEPTYEFGNPAQRLKLVLNDQLRTLLPELRKRNLKLQKSYALSTLANPTNPTGVHVIDIENT